jgi:dihydropteroate synthase
MHYGEGNEGGMRSLVCGSRTLDLTAPVVMSIVNVTPDSFFDGGKYPALPDLLRAVEQMLADGASILDVGAISTRPGAPDVNEKEEMKRLLPAVGAITRHFPESIISVDTFRPLVARTAIEAGASIINDIYGGRYHEGMFETIATYNVPYILMHMKGTPATMQHQPEYEDVVAEVFDFFQERLAEAAKKGVRQLIIDPGFGFGKTLEQNYTLLSSLDKFKKLGFPVLAGLSRKSMICRILGMRPAEALNGTTVLNTVALMKGADILRVHDVKEAIEAIRLVNQLDIENIINRQSIN